MENTRKKETKKFYWLKLKDDFINKGALDFLMSQENGANYVVLYMKLCMMTINTDGEFYEKIGEIIIPYDAKKIQRDCKYFNLDTVLVALELYKKLGLVFIQENGNLKISDYSSLVGYETNWAQNKRIVRENIRKKEASQKLLPIGKNGKIAREDNVLSDVLPDVPPMSYQESRVKSQEIKTIDSMMTEDKKATLTSSSILEELESARTPAFSKEEVIHNLKKRVKWENNSEIVKILGISNEKACNVLAMISAIWDSDSYLRPVILKLNDKEFWKIVEYFCKKNIKDSYKYIRVSLENML